MRQALLSCTDLDPSASEGGGNASNGAAGVMEEGKVVEVDTSSACTG